MIKEFGFLDTIFSLIGVGCMIIHHYVGIYLEILGIIYLIKIVKGIIKKKRGIK